MRNEDLVTRAEAARILGCAYTTMQSMERSGKIKPAQTVPWGAVGRMSLFLRSDIERLRDRWNAALEERDAARAAKHALRQAAVQS